MRSRRDFLKLIGATGASVGALTYPVWWKYGGHAMRSHAQQPANSTAAQSSATAAPGPLGPVVGTDGRPVVYDLDIGRVMSVGPSTALLGAGAGPRLLRIRPDALVWFEGIEAPYADGRLIPGDWVEAAGTTLSDMSLDTTRLTLNSLGNLIGLFDRSSNNDLLVYMRAGRERGSYQTAATTIHTDERTKFYRGRGNFSDANGSLAQARRGSWVMCKGYLTRDGGRHALHVYFGNELPPEDTPGWLLQAIRG